MESLSGRELKQLRESKGLTLESVALGTHLRISIIEAIESDTTSDLLSPIYMDLSRSTYARYLSDVATKQAEAKQAASAPTPPKPPASAEKPAGKR